jgi:hypothetical protein
VELPQHHHWTRWWLRRYGKYSEARRPQRVTLYDRALRQDVGASLQYPGEIDAAIQQLRSLRQRDHEPNDNYIFCDGYGNL